MWVLLLGSATAQGVTFWVPTHAPNHLATHFESVSAFLSYPAPGYLGHNPPLESYMSQRRLWGGRGSSRVRLPYTVAITMALKRPFSSLYHYPGLSRPEAFPRHRSLHGLSYPWLPCLSDIWSWRRLASAMLVLGVSPPRRRLVLTLTPGVDFDLDFVNARIRDGTTLNDQFSLVLKITSYYHIILQIISWNYLRFPLTKIFVLVLFPS